MTGTTETGGRRSADNFWKQKSLRTAAHIVRDLSKETGIPIDAAVQRVLDEEARESAKTA